MTRSLLSLAGSALLLAACGVTGPGHPGVAALEAAQARWTLHGPDSYVFAVQRNCFCGPDYRGPARLTVENGVVTDAEYVDSGLPVPSDSAFPTVDELFELLRSAYDADADDVTVTYDPQLGVPMEAWIDYLEMAADEELGWLVTEAVTPVP